MSVIRQFEVTDEDKRLISGWCTVEIVDRQGDIVPVSEIKRSMYDFMDRGGFIIYGHSNKPVGKILQWDIKEHPETKTLGVWFVAKIFDDYEIDDIVWEKIKSGEIKGFSIGATAKGEEKKILKDEATGMPKEVDVLRGLELLEISLVEEPANPLALVEEVNFIAKGETKKESDAKKLEEEAIRKRIEKLESITRIAKEITESVEKAMIEVMKPFGKWENFDACVLDMKERGYDEESAKRICGKLQAALENENTEDEAVRENAY